MAVFGRPESFDPRLDSVVRVEATRLRNRLQSYYESVGGGDPIEISLPVGTYTLEVRQLNLPETGVATVESNAETGSEVAALLPSGSPVRWLKRRWLSVAAAVLLLGTCALAVKGRLFEAQAPSLVLLQHLAKPGEVLLSPVLSPDSRHLYYASNRDGGRLRIWRQLLEDGGAQPMTPPQRDSYDLDVSPDGNWLAYYADREGGGLYQQAIRGGPELLIAPLGRSPRFSRDGRQVLFWVEDAHTGFGRVYSRRVSREPYPEEPHQVAGEFADAHNPQWTPDGRVLLCGTLRTNVKELEHDLWIVPASGVTPPLKTGIAQYLKARGINLHSRALKTTSFQFYDGSLVFAAVRDDRTSLFALPLSTGFEPRGEPSPLYEDENSQDSPAARQNLLAFTSSRSSLNVWRVPLGTDGVSEGEAVRLTDSRGDAVLPSISISGQVLYLTLRTEGTGIWRKDLVTGVEREIYRGPGINRLKATPNGSTAFFRMMVGPPPQLQTLYQIEPAGGEVRQICANCGAPTSVSPSGEYVVYETGSAVFRLAVIQVPTGERQEILRHPHHGVQAGRISPDGRWILFELDRGPDGVQLFVAPFRGLRPIPETDWTPVSGANCSSFEPAWSPDGSAVYFLSDRNGSRDLWMQRLQPDKRGLGTAILVHRFSNPRLTPLTYHVRHPRYVGLSIAPRAAILTLAEMNSTVWLGKFSR